ncbi:MULTISPECIES: acyl carrier protein [unclassified Phyllobacterium]|uniref:acyl carrier protein n=1 Tax=unclassified Phyllobacterium TaxID=2638441 RepID=UPI0030130059
MKNFEKRRQLLPGNAVNMESEAVNAESVKERIVSLFEAEIKIDATDIDWSTPLSEIGLDSLDLTELMFAIEEEFDIALDFNASEASSQLGSLDDFVSAVQAALAEMLK